MYEVRPLSNRTCSRNTVFVQQMICNFADVKIKHSLVSN